SFGGYVGIGAERLSTTQIAVYTPPHAVGVVDVVVTMGATPVTLSSAYVYIPGLAGISFTQTTGISVLRGDRPGKAILSDGRWVVTGGTTTQGVFTTTLASTDIADASTNVFSAGPAMQVPRAHHTATTLGDGRILITGGVSNGVNATNTTELLNAAGTA